MLGHSIRGSTSCLVSSLPLLNAHGQDFPHTASPLGALPPLPPPPAPAPPNTTAYCSASPHRTHHSAMIDNPYTDWGPTFYHCQLIPTRLIIFKWAEKIVLIFFFTRNSIGAYSNLLNGSLWMGFNRDWDGYCVRASAPTPPRRLWASLAHSVPILGLRASALGC